MISTRARFGSRASPCTGTKVASILAEPGPGQEAGEARPMKGSPPKILDAIDGGPVPLDGGLAGQGGQARFWTLGGQGRAAGLKIRRISERTRGVSGTCSSTQQTKAESTDADSSGIERASARTGITLPSRMGSSGPSGGSQIGARRARRR